MKKILLIALPLLALGAAPALAEDHGSNGNFGVMGLTGLTGTLGGTFEGSQTLGARVGGGSLVAGGTLGDRMGSMTASEVSSYAFGNAITSSTAFINPNTAQLGGTAQSSFASNAGGFGASNLGGFNSFVAGSIGGGVAGTAVQMGAMGMLQFAPMTTP